MISNFNTYIKPKKLTGNRTFLQKTDSRLDGRTLFAGESAPAERARVVVGKPRGDTRFVEDMATRDLFTYSIILATRPKAFDADRTNITGCSSNRRHAH